MEFRILIADAGWNEEASRVAFVKGISKKVKDELMSYDDPVARAPP